MDDYALRLPSPRVPLADALEASDAQWRAFVALHVAGAILSTDAMIDAVMSAPHDPAQARQLLVMRRKEFLSEMKALGQGNPTRVQGAQP